LLTSLGNDIEGQNTRKSTLSTDESNLTVFT